jgi:NAD(P)-dependent dehydrogenase (short-subunit alcohol dehydrogenase family)
VTRPVALITAASRGIGRSTAQAFIDRGYNVTITARKPEALNQTAALLGDATRVLAIAGNSGDAEHRHAVVASTIERFGRLDALVNNAGINPAVGPLAEMDLDAVRKILDVNLVGALGWVQEAHAQWLSENGGTVVNVASTAGLTPQPLIGAYGVSKSALAFMTRQLASEMGPRVRVNAVAPAVVRTRFGGPLFEGKEEQVAEAYPLKRIGETDDVASAIVFLSSVDSGWITGQTLILDGGLLNNGAMSAGV